ncbi:MAG: PRD domain-containing protein [Erysipelotrichaceae bacterium]|nr:PRD domain-containing protein [Erysipelotrichaceae bacterium]
MKAIKNLNNNTAICLDYNGREVVAFGKGIGFNKTPNEIPLSKIDRTFYNVDPNYFQIIPEIDEKVIRTAVKIVDHANEVKNNRYSSNLIFALADHIQFAIKRAKKGMRISIGLLFEIENSYPDEIEIARHALKVVREELGIALGKEEVGSIAIHLIDYIDTPQMTQMDAEEDLIERYTAKIEDLLQIGVDRQDYSYKRFAAHIHYLLQRKKDGNELNKQMPEFLGDLKDRYEKEYECACLLEEMIGSKLSEEEKAYILIHVNRLKSAK